LELHITAPATATLGAALVIEVVYANRGTAPIEFREPAKTWEVMLITIHDGGPAERLPLGRFVVRESDGITDQVREPADTVSLAPGGEHRFSIDVWGRWPEQVEPGRLRLRIVDQTDDARTLVSNVVDVLVRFEETSVPALVELLRQEGADYEARALAVRLLGELKPGFQARLEVATDADRAANRASAAAFESWWAAHRSDKKVREAIARINGRSLPSPPIIP